MQIHLWEETVTMKYGRMKATLILIDPSTRSTVALERTLLILVPNMEMSLPIVNISLLSIPNGRMSIDQAEIFDYDRWYSYSDRFL